MIISTKAGYDMWPGPYGEWGSRKYLLASLDQSLKRMKVDYVDIFYSHRPDTETPLEETMGALASAVHQGKALYAGISSYPPDLASKAIDILKQMGAPCLIHQPSYSMFNRWAENGLLNVLEEKGVGCIAFSPLAQALLTKKYLEGIPKGSRADKPHGFLKPEEITIEKIKIIKKLNDFAKTRNQSLAQMALVWLLKDKRITSVIVGASTVNQLEENIRALDNREFSDDELTIIETMVANQE